MIDKTRRVSVYFNLHKKIWSVRQSGSPVEHHTEVCLKDVRYLCLLYTSPSPRDRG